jgi:hypothetical protein
LDNLILKDLILQILTRLIEIFCRSFNSTSISVPQRKPLRSPEIKILSTDKSKDGKGVKRSGDKISEDVREVMRSTPSKLSKQGKATHYNVT